MVNYVPLTCDQPLDYAYERPQYFRNAPRESAWGKPVYFVPPTLPVGQLGQAGPGYEYGKPYNINQGDYGNCTWWVMGRCYEANGDPIAYCSGDAFQYYAKYKGDKDGGSFTSGKYFGDTIKPGDILVYADNKTNGITATAKIKYFHFVLKSKSVL